MDDKGDRLPAFGPTPTRHADCCLSLSTTLLDRIIKTFSKTIHDDRPHTLLSIGSGSGLLESLLTFRKPTSPSTNPFLVEGVEVQQPDTQSPVNKYLPEQHSHIVQRTSTVSPRLYESDVRGLLFVYPRQPSLVKQYTSQIQAGNTHITTIIWLGPRADWHDFPPCFNLSRTQSDVVSGTEAGLDEYELMAIIRIHRGADP